MIPAAGLLCLALVQSPRTAGADDGYVPRGPTQGRPAAPYANSVDAAGTVLPPRTPDYFEAVYPHLLKSPLPARIYNQGGIPPVIPRLQMTANPYGRLATYLPSGPVYTARHAFFRPLGTNGRSCATCHQPPSGMSFSLRNVRARFLATKSTDPIFAPVDGANCPDAVPAQHTSGAPYGGRRGKGRKALKDAYSLLLGRGLIRVAMPWPPKGNADPEFSLELLSDAPRCNSSPEFGLGTGIVSVYRRPQMSAQLNFKTARPDGTGPVLPGSVMWDGREPSLEQQAIDATRGHAQASRDPTPEEIREIVDFETGIYSAQLVDRAAGRLDRDGAEGGPVHLAGRAVDPVFRFPPRPFGEYDGWAGQGGARRAIADGQRIFQERTLMLGNVLPPELRNPFRGTCATCHNAGHAGSSVVRPPLRDIGVGGTGRAFGGPPPAADLPVFRLTCRADAPPHPFLGHGPVETNDPGLALLTGRCADIGKFGVPQLRALAAREPYFHDGSARTLEAVVRLYEQRFQFDPPLSDQDRADLVRFLGAL